MLELKGVYLSYEQEQNKVCVLNNINLKIKKGSSLALVGMSGCGKTSLLHIMAGLKKPTKGVVFLKQKIIEKPQSEISIIFQNLGLFPWKTVRDNITLPLKLQHKKTSSQHVREIIEQTNMAEHLDKYPFQLSGGQQQRVAIARAIINNAELILMDEPFSSLDILNRERLRQFMLDTFQRQNLTSVIVTHNIEEALMVGEYIAVLGSDDATTVTLVDNQDYCEKGYLESKKCLEKRKYIKSLLI